MKKTVFTAIIMLILVISFVSCGWNVEIVDPTKPIENDSELVISEDETEEKHIKNIYSEKAETKNLTEEGFANLRGSSIAFHILENSKALFFSYKEGDPFEGGGVSVRVYIYDYERGKTEFVEELSFSDYKEVSVYERDGKAKVVFSNIYSTEVLSIDTETLESERKELDYSRGNISETGLWATGSEHVTIRDIEDDTVVSVIETGEIKKFGSWSSNCEFFHVYKNNSEEIYSISGEKMVEINKAETRNWCAESNCFVYSEIDENYIWKMWILDVLSGEKKELDVEPGFLYLEKDFAFIKNGGKLCLKEYSTGKIFELVEDFGEFNYYEKVAYDKENETVIAAAYKDGSTEVWKIKLEWEEGPGEKAEPSEEKEEPETGKALPAVEGDFVLFETIQDRIYKSLEFDDRIVCFCVNGNIAAFDIETGEKIYEYSLGEADEYSTFDFMKIDYKEGFDFSISMEDKIVYLSSKNPEIMEEVFLPENVTESICGGVEVYSVYGNRITWISDEGIRISDIDGKNEEMLISVDDIETKIKPIAEEAYEGLYYVDNNEVCCFYEVSFICGGEKVAVTVTSEKTYLYWATALYDIESGEFEWAYLFNEMVNADYPFGDKYVTVAKKWINTETGNYKNFRTWVKSADGEIFIRSETDDMDGTGLRVFCGDFNTIEDGGEKIFEILDKTVDGALWDVMENYVRISFHIGNDRWNCIVRYR